MCRYAMIAYKPHYACFTCRKTFKRRLLKDVDGFDHSRPVAAKCPQCGELMANMGLDFEAPKKENVKAWQHLQRLYSVDITYHSCGCSGPGYIPASRKALITYFREILQRYESQLEFWRSRVEPANKKEIDRENSKYSNYIYSVPSGIRPKKGAITNAEAINYWIDRIQEIEAKISLAAK